MPSVELDVEAPAALALRALQKLDHVTELRREDRTRLLLVDALDALGEQLGLNCNGLSEGNGDFDHSGDTCPIHEWLVEADFNEVDS